MDQLWNLRCYRWTEHLKVWKLPSLKVICGKLTKICDHIAPQSGEILQTFFLRLSHHLHQKIWIKQLSFVCFKSWNNVGGQHCHYASLENEGIWSHPIALIVNCMIQGNLIGLLVAVDRVFTHALLETFRFQIAGLDASSSIDSRINKTTFFNLTEMFRR